MGGGTRLVKEGGVGGGTRLVKEGWVGVGRGREEEGRGKGGGKGEGGGGGRVEEERAGYKIVNRSSIEKLQHVCNIHYIIKFTEK